MASDQYVLVGDADLPVTLAGGIYGSFACQPLTHRGGLVFQLSPYAFAHDGMCACHRQR